MKIRIFALVIMLSAMAQGQVNTEKMRMGLDRSGFAGNFKLSYSIVAGNSELTRIDISPNIIRKLQKHQFFTLNNLSRVYSDDGTIINKAFSHLRYNYEITPVYIYEFFLQAQYNRSQKLDHRFLIGSGMRIVPVETEHFLWAIGLTLMHEEEKLSSGQITKTPRNSDYIYLKYQPSDRIFFENTIYFQPALDDFENVRVLDEAQVTIGITETFALTTEINYFYDSQPPEGVE
ncbi:MAG: DUF481 domain-containing protein, partial [candidate division Zixibacteria bacterium]|nr:DUF481 domain-containing protein [candidate division Zixibacteria bacterium]